ncbi:MAG: hypothetical protein V3R81_04665 [Gammaproteobacteria bacterium]
MEYEIRSINPKPAAKVLAFTLLILGIVVGLLVSVLAWFLPETVAQPAPSTLILRPLISAVVGYISIQLFCLIYNWIAQKWGGIRLNLAEIHSPLNPKWKP